MCAQKTRVLQSRVHPRVIACYINATTCETLTKMNAELCNFQLGMPFPKASCENCNQAPRVMLTLRCCFRPRTPFPQCLGNYLSSSICTRLMGCFHSQNKDKNNKIKQNSSCFHQLFSSSFHCCLDAELLARFQLKTQTWFAGKDKFQMSFSFCVMTYSHQKERKFPN